MFEAVEARVRAAAAARARAVVRGLAEREAPPGVRVEAEEERLVLSGRGLARRMVSEAALRWWRL